MLIQTHCLFVYCVSSIALELGNEPVTTCTVKILPPKRQFYFCRRAFQTKRWEGPAVPALSSAASWKLSVLRSLLLPPSRLQRGCAQFSWGKPEGSRTEFWSWLAHWALWVGATKDLIWELSRLQRLEKQPSFIAQLIKLPLQNSVHLFSEQTLGVKARKIQYF